MDEWDESTPEESLELIEDAVADVAFALDPVRSTSMSCAEVEAMVNLFHVAGMDAAADDWLNRHVATEDPDVARERHGLDVDYLPRFLVTCPSCGAEPEHGCVTSDGTSFGVSAASCAHTSRVQLAGEG